LVREMLRPELSAVEVIDCPSLLEARERLRDQPFDCLLLDLSLPDADGLEAVEQVRDADPAVPIVVLTGNDDERIGVRAVKAGAQDYLIKGRADGVQLSRAIRYAIERKRAEAELAHLALHDPLTGLPNRALLLDRLALALARTRRQPAMVAVLFLDLDGFKDVNDTFGHDAGDEALALVAARLVEAVRPTDTVARFGGDEFVILLDDVDGSAHAARVADRVIAELARPFAVTGGETLLGASVGAAVATLGEDPEAVVRRADSAMYRAKAQGGGHFAVEQQSARGHGDLADALDRHDLVVNYRPLAGLGDGVSAGLRAYLRRGDGAAVQAAAVPGRVGEWALGRACRDVAGGGLSADGLLVVDVPAAALPEAEQAANLAAVARATGLPAEKVCVTVAERALMAEPEVGAERLRALRAAGLRVALRDFGGGPTLLRLLAELPIDLVVLDASLVSALPGRDPQRAVIAAAVAVAHALGARVLAVDAQGEDRRRALLAAGCDFLELSMPA
ncbi:MAG TPA: diguanylate cyclase, partial [Solirubrobacteraceae bacterium]